MLIEDEVLQEEDNFTCPKCKSINTVGEYKFDYRTDWECVECGKTWSTKD